MECPSCQQVNRDEAMFCRSCGTPLGHACPHCGQEVIPGSRFCDSCGHSLSPATPAPAPASGSAGERRQATVLFSDLSGYTAMNEKLDPEEVEGIMSRIKTEAVGIVESHGGIVSQFVGDEVLALFGIPTAHEDDPHRAVQAARALHEVAHRLSPDVESRIGRPLRMHTGIHSGLIVTSLRDDRDGRIGVTGDTVNTGARLKALAEDDTILVSPETRRRVAPYFHTEALPAVELKGKAGRMVPHRIVAETEVETRFEAELQRGFTPFTGREQELALLRACTDGAKAGRGQLIRLRGETGAGKTRLLYEFGRTLLEDEAVIVRGRCHGQGAETPYLPFLGAMRRYFDLQEEDAPETLREKVVTRAEATRPGLEPWIPHYLHLLSIPAGQHPLPEGLKEAALREALNGALAALLTVNALKGPVALVMENWQWADEASAAAMQHLIALIPHHPLLVIVSFRPEFAGSLACPGFHTPIDLPPLGVEDTEAIMRAIFQQAAPPEGLAALVQERTAGNPMFAEELCQSLLQEGIVVLEQGRAVLTRPLDAVRLPDTVHAAIRARVDNLDDRSREVLKLASVIGRQFALKLLARLQSAPAGLANSLQGLQAQALIQQVQETPEADYTFRNIVTRLVVYETLLHAQRRELHAMVGQAIEALYPTRLEEHYAALAHHFRNSGDTERAVHYLERAGDKAAQVFALHDARAHFRRAVLRLDEDLSGADAQRKRIDLSLKWAEASAYQRREEVIAALERSLELAEALKDEPRLAKASFYLGQMYYHMGDILQSLPWFERCVAMAERLGDEALLGLPYNVIGRTCLFTRRFDQGRDYLGKGIAMMERLGNTDEVAYSKGILALIAGVSGSLAEAFSLAEDALRLSIQRDNRMREAATRIYLSYLRSFLGEYETCYQLGAAAVRIAREIGVPVLEGLASGVTGYAMFCRGSRQEGLGVMREGVALIEGAGSLFTLAVCYGMLAESLAVTGQAEEARRCGAKALELGNIGDRLGEFFAYRGLATAAAHAQPPAWDEAETHLQKALQAAADTGSQPDLAVTLIHHARLLQERGDPARAKQQVERARELLRRLEMAWWLVQADELAGRLGAA